MQIRPRMCRSSTATLPRRRLPVHLSDPEVLSEAYGFVEFQAKS